MRTTIYLPDDLLAQVKKLAARTNRTLTAVIADALREVLARGRRTEQTPLASLTTHGRRGLRPGIDLDDTAGLLDAMEPPRDPARR
jgi:hypothetical protein